jgi:ACS family hexuronate transporter-like MFS transporter
MGDLKSDEPSAQAAVLDRQTPLRAWGICGLMLLATMLNYMDRQTLAQQATDIRAALELTNEDYSGLESGFGFAFAAGGIVTGIVTDTVSLRWLYPAILMGWSAVGFATGWVTTYRELLICRILLGFFEAGQWPCALAASQRLLRPGQRTLGNSILQSGASLGAIVTPQVILLLNTGGAGGWRLPFQVVGGAGLFWIVAWLIAIRPNELEIAPLTASGRIADPGDPQQITPGPSDEEESPADRAVFLSRFLALIVVVISINLCWQFFRAWMPMMLEKQYGYAKDRVQHFSSLYYLVAGIGCLLVGIVTRWLIGAGWSVHRARMVTFAICVLLTALSVVAAVLPASGLLLLTLLAIGFGSLGQFPTYYALTQELSVLRMGKVTGVLSFVTWISWAVLSIPIGRWIERASSYAEVTLLAGLVPLLGLAALVLLWNPRSADVSGRRRRTISP